MKLLTKFEEILEHDSQCDSTLVKKAPGIYGDRDCDCIVRDQVERLREAVKQYNAVCVGEDAEIPSNVEHPHYQRYVEDTLTQNSMKDEIRQRQEENL